MAKIVPSISDDLRTWMMEQHLFFVGSAPLTADGHVNISPKGQETFRFFSPNRVGYLDLTGSGNETSAHMKENGRITFMFCAFTGAPRILRLYGKGRVVLPDDTEWTELAPHFDLLPGARQIVMAEVDIVQTSCGFAVPLLDYVTQRDTLIKWAETKGEDGLEAYWQEKNVQSLDCLPTHIANRTVIG